MKNLQAVQLQLELTNIEFNIRYPDIEANDALDISKQTKVKTCLPTHDVSGYSGVVAFDIKKINNYNYDCLQSGWELTLTLRFGGAT